MKKPQRGQVFVAVEGVYSMDGDLAPLPEIAAACRAYDAYLIVDDAHGTGILGERGGGTAEHFGVVDAVDIAMGTMSKALAVTGGFLAARAEVTQYLRFFARSYMFSAHMAPMVAAAARAGLEVIRREPERRARLLENARNLRAALVALGFDVIPGEAAILAVRIPASVDIRRLALRFHEEGIFLNAIEPPAVAPREQRLRLSVMTTHTLEDLGTCRLDV